MIIPIVTGDGRRIDHDTDEADDLRLAALCEDVPAELWGLFTDGESPPLLVGHGAEGREEAAGDHGQHAENDD